MQNIDAYVAQLQESFKKLIDTFKKYNIRHIPNIGENFIEIAFVLDDIYESVCREMKGKYNIQCVRIKDYYAYTLVTKGTVDSIKYELTSPSLTQCLINFTQNSQLKTLTPTHS